MLQIGSLMSISHMLRLKGAGFSNETNSYSFLISSLQDIFKWLIICIDSVPTALCKSI